MRYSNRAKRDINIVLIIVGILGAVLLYFFLYTDFADRTEALNYDTQALTARLDELLEHEASVPMYNEKTREYAAQITTELGNYSQQVRTEDLIMYAVMLEDEMKLDISSASFTDPEVLSTFALPTADGNISFTAYSVSMTVNTRMGYSDMKDAITRVYTTQDRTVLDSLSIVFDGETGGLAGTITISKVFVDDGSYIYWPTDVPSGSLGNPNPFGTIEIAAPSVPVDAPNETP